MHGESGPTTVAVRPNYGTFSNESEVLVALTRRLVDALDPAMVWLFGSRARQDGRPDSDFDLMVVAKENGSSRFDANDYDKVYAPLRGLGIGVDVIPCDFETYAVSLRLRTSFVHRIVDEGRLLYEASP